MPVSSIAAAHLYPRPGGKMPGNKATPLTLRFAMAE